jgi:hypothetical protein
MLEGAERFFRAFSNLPVPIRKDIIFVDETNGPITWLVAYVEIKDETELGQKILARMSEMKIV